MKRKNYGGEQSPYWNWVRRHKFNSHTNQSEHFFWEPPDANPDLVPEKDEPTIQFSSILKRALHEIKFSKVEQAVLLLVSQGHTQDKTAEILGVSRTRVRQALSRIQKKGEEWYGTNMANSGDIDGEEQNLE